jgi:phospholipid/cholesterol/gamma-HCH transport system substrate-binding protein
MTTRFIEIMVGVFVVLGFLALFMLAMKVSTLSRISAKEGYEVSAYFENIGGLKVRAPVTVSGVRVGQVTEITYNPKRFEAQVKMRIGAEHDYFPIDTTASIYTAGLLGEQYLALEPGAENEVLKAGDTIEFTQSALILEEIIGKIVVKLTSGK